MYCICRSCPRGAGCRTIFGACHVHLSASRTASFRFSDLFHFFIRVVPAGRRRARNYLSNDRLIALEFQATSVAAWPCLLRQRGRALISTIEQEKGRAAKRQPAGSASRVQPPADEQHEAREAAAAVVAARPRCRQQQRRRRQHQQHTGRCRALSAMPAAGIPQPSSTSDASERPQPRSSTGVLHRWCVAACVQVACVRTCEQPVHCNIDGLYCVYSANLLSLPAYTMRASCIGMILELATLLFTH